MDDIRFPPRGSEDASPALALQGLCKAFGQKIAVNMLSLTVPTGSIYGMVGPNGAGKTTTLSMATGLLVPDAGRAAVHGTDVWARPGPHVGAVDRGAAGVGNQQPGGHG